MTQLLREENIEKIEGDLKFLKNRYSHLSFKIINISFILRDLKAKEYLLQGVHNRLQIIKHSVDKIFSIYPIRRNNVLSESERMDIVMYLHAFFVNSIGLFDNMAWVVINQKNMADKINRRNVGIFSPKTQKYFSYEFTEYLNSEGIRNWHDNYLKEYRNALSHRIPINIPAMTINFDKEKKEDEELENKMTEAIERGDFHEALKLKSEIDNFCDPAPLFFHSPSEKGNSVLLHSQVTIDFKTFVEIVDKFCEMLESYN